MRSLVIQPPFVQLNAPYPAVHYLAAWLRGRGLEVGVEDHSIELYREIFSRRGLALVFAEAERRLGSGTLPEEGAVEVVRYLSYRRLYQEWIGPVLDYLSGGDPAFAHRLAAAVEFPRGARVEAFLDTRGRRPGTEDAPRLASLLLEDLGDLIVHAVDRDFGTVHYGERLGRSREDFGEVLEGLEGAWIARELYRPLLASRFAELAEGGAPDFLLLSLPFPGTLTGALACASEARRAFGESTCIVFGGGYVSTELRGLRDPRLFDFCDYLCFDAGYGALARIFEARREGLAPPAWPAEGLYRTMTRRGGAILASGFPAGDLAAEAAGCDGPASRQPLRSIQAGPDPLPLLALEGEAVADCHPDWRDFDPSRYLRPLDSTNPMHRLWTESPWLKYRLAQGCYWKRCAFCDTQLDYVSSFLRSELEPLLEAMDRASEGTGLSGIHFVDEALPMGRLLAFAEANRKRAAAGKKQYHYWGNIRFDASWTPERCELLAASGLVAVSGGIEVASEAGLAMTDKGFDLPSLVRTLVALRQAGLLVHAYLIYGFPGQDRASILESADFVRGLFAAGLVDSAFWHRFVLTRHSRMMAEWKEGGRPELSPRDRGGSFAANDLEFEGEEAFDSYGKVLDAALGAWMEGQDLDRPAAEWFDEAAAKGRRFRPSSSAAARKAAGAEDGAPSDGVSRVEGLIAEAEGSLENRLTRQWSDRGTAHWTAGLPRGDLPGGSPGRIAWARRGELEDLQLGSAARAERARAAIADLAARPEGLGYGEFRKASGLSAEELGLLGREGLLVLEGAAK